MIRFALATLAFVGATPALAGGTAEAPVAPPVIVPTVSGSDWTGAYAGLQVDGIADGTISLGGIPDDLDGTLYGIFGGYRYDFGSLVLGAELDYMVGEGSVGGLAPFDVDYDQLLRLGLEAGFDLGNALVYATAGFASIEVTDQFGTSDDSSGYFYGLGADFRISDRMTVGLEILRHEFDDFALPTTVEATTVGVNLAVLF